MKFKIIQSDSIHIFESEIEAFFKEFEVLNIDYKPVGLAPDVEAGWNTELVYTALVTYKVRG